MNYFCSHDKSVDEYFYVLTVVKHSQEFRCVAGSRRNTPLGASCERRMVLPSGVNRLPGLKHRGNYPVLFRWVSATASWKKTLCMSTPFYSASPPVNSRAH
jgi:hypothetical protein